ncbi:carboxylesterase family protein [Vibrio cyclitrophicus 1F53]|uniref:carboxylesterase family protein n=1 Tax=Vibrio cyclitrophicus TaxID=47951 RepID=UPI000312354E|nr:carboxylesterase family protein [Vibrio cyclitrophicus]NOI34098.1 carboxylesterase/lipase family protein [Vibrio cyclitrophicus]OEF34450.1 para-nitrobenzyl esterase [Vibrio cyclitrophicus 1F53]OEF67122.1 para-nitrobenzyl esterase [Vibrio cyclitrophicus 1F175]PMH33237.1 para-nitrobenzyl esterase [Vibrio cyclitrophicus]PMH87632.1 para-nitrobenzyl esterase [Vibrio cyclitrophicus]
MTIAYRSMIALTIAAALAGCDTDTAPTVPLPDKPEPLVPAPVEPFTAQIGDVTIKATKEELVITSNTEDNKLTSVESFKGIKFAEAERFEHSELIGLGTDIDATAFGDACPQLKTVSQTQSEDCLNLNIWRPVDLDADADLPVYVFIHGGDFEYGSGSEALVHGDTVVAQGSDDGKPFIYVSLNYRLGQLGTQWIKGANEDGNYGLGDQKRALEWVHNNITDFGGNAQNVTVIGQGSGAMSIGFLQQDDDIAGQYFQRSIMQSNPYGFEYASYDVAKDRNNDFDANTSIDEIMASQETDLNGIEQLKNWLLGSLQIPILSPAADETPMSNLMPFAPYILCEKTSLLGSCSESAESPIQAGFSVPTVLGENAHEANSFGMLFTTTFLIPTVIELLANDEPELLTNEELAQLALAMVNWLEDQNNIVLLQQKLSERASDEVSAELVLPSSAYSAVTSLFYGAKLEGDLLEMTGCIDTSDIAGTLGCLVDIVDITSHQQTQDILALTDFYPNSQATLGDATANMKQFKTLLNDTLFNGPARYMAANSEVQATLYHFEHKPSFNMWNFKTALNEETGEYDQLSIIDLFKTIGCISGACNGSELPFMFNKAVRFDGSEIHPTSNEKALMNEMSRLWFSEELFTNYQYSDSADNVLVIESQGFSDNTTYDWDYVTNPGVDPKLREGRLTGLTEQGLMPWDWYLN